MLSSDCKFKSVLVLDNGTFFALATSNGTWNRPYADTILTSTNQGRTWRDLSTGTDRLEITRLFPDPDHKNLVCISGQGAIRGYVLQAEDETYQWKWTAEFVWNPRVQTDEIFFQETIFTSSGLHGFYATLENYFLYDFRGKVRTHAFHLSLENPSYMFKKSDPKRTNSKVELYPLDSSTKLVDFNDGFEVWGARIKTPNTNYIYSGMKRTQSGERLRMRKDFKTIAINSDNPYRRTIDLGELFDFKEKGEYLVQLLYDSTDVADKSKGEWPGGFSSQPFQVVVR